MKRVSKISGVLFLLALTALMLYMSFNLDEERQYTIEVIEIDGDVHLPKDRYYKFAKLDDEEKYPQLKLEVIKDRLDKHPYVSRAHIKYDGEKKVSVEIAEKEFEALLLNKGRQYLVTSGFEVLPMLPYSKQIDYPVISNPAIVDSLAMFKSCKRNTDVVKAFKIISAVKLLDPELYSSLSEVDMRNGKDIILYFSNIDYPVVIGRKNEIRKIAYFNTLWKGLKHNQINSVIRYVDLRFDEHIYLGFDNELLELGGSQS